MTESEWTKVREIVEKNMDKIVESINDADINVGYWPDDTAAMVDVVMAVLRHQSRIDEYHVREGTSF